MFLFAEQKRKRPTKKKLPKSAIPTPGPRKALPCSNRPWGQIRYPRDRSQERAKDIEKCHQGETTRRRIVENRPTPRPTKKLQESHPATRLETGKKTVLFSAQAPPDPPDQRRLAPPAADIPNRPCAPSGPGLDLLVTTGRVQLLCLDRNRLLAGKSSPSRVSLGLSLSMVQSRMVGQKKRFQK